MSLFKHSCNWSLFYHFDYIDITPNFSSSPTSTSTLSSSSSHQHQRGDDSTLNGGSKSNIKRKSSVGQISYPSDKQKNNSTKRSDNSVSTSSNSNHTQKKSKSNSTSDSSHQIKDIDDIETAYKSSNGEENNPDNVGLNHNRHKLVPDGNDFKLVFISSDSSKESDNLNSSLEGANSPDALNLPNREGAKNLQSSYPNNSLAINKNCMKRDFDCIATSSPKESRSTYKGAPKLPPKNTSRRPNSKVEGSTNSSGASSMEMDPSKINENGSNPSRNSGGAPQFMLDHDLHHYDTGIIGAGSCSSPSINTIRTAATRDIDSPVSTYDF